MIYEYFANIFNLFNQSANIRILFQNKKLIKKKCRGAPWRASTNNVAINVYIYFTTIFSILNFCSS